MKENDGVLRVLFDGVWGCKIEMFFDGDVSYNTDSRDPDLYDPYWYGSTMIRQDGYIYFVDDDDMKVEDIKLEEKLNALDTPYMSVVELAFVQLHKDKPYEITRDFIMDLGNAFLFGKAARVMNGEV